MLSYAGRMGLCFPTIHLAFQSSFPNHYCDYYTANLLR